MELAAAAPWQMWATLAIIAVGVFFYVLERFPLELVSAAILVALLLLFNLAPLQNAAGEILLTTEGLLAGFASPALFAIVGLLIIGQGMFQSGALEHLTEYLLGAYSNRPRLTVAAV
ncbi:MAG: SLC13 family permease, partial [Pseudomonadota bacterium]